MLRLASRRALVSRRALILFCAVTALASLTLFAGSGFVRAADDEELPPAEGADTTSTASYSIGWNIGTGLKSQRTKVDMAAIVRGLQDALKGAKPQFTEEEMQAAMQAFSQQQSANWQKENEAFLVENGKQKEIKTLPSGLQYKVLKAADGKKPKATDQVTTHYRGTLIDGTVFDSSYDRGEPATFPLNRVIPAWTEALQLMAPGAKWQLFVPSKLGYGARGAPPAIAPHSTLIFEVELIEIK